MTHEEPTRDVSTAPFASLPIAELLTRFVTKPDPDVFAALVRQLGPLVLGTCQRVLGRNSDDAFQAVFLALARHAKRFRNPKTLPAWLHRASVRVARQLRDQRKPTSALPDAADSADPTENAIRQILDEELDRLPDKYRGPLILCWLEGAAHEDAAVRLGVSVNVLKRRLEGGRARLHRRLVRHGIAATAVNWTMAMPLGSRAELPAELVAKTVQVCTSGEPVPAALRKLAATRHSSRGYVKYGLLLIAGAAIAVGGWFAVKALRPPVPPADTTIIVQLDGPEDPLPEGAVARYGTTRFRVPHRIHDRSYDPLTGGGNLSSDGRLFYVRAVGGFPEYTGRGISICETTTGRLVRQISETTNGYFSPDGQYFGYSDNSPRRFILHIPSGEIASFGEGYLSGVESDGFVFVPSRVEEGKADVFDPATRRIVRSKPKVSAAWLRGNGFEIYWKDKFTPVARDIQTQQELFTFSIKTGLDRRYPQPFERSPEQALPMAVSPDSQFVAAMRNAGAELQIWQTDPWGERFVLPSPIQGVFNFDGSWYAGYTPRVVEEQSGRDRFRYRFAPKVGFTADSRTALMTLANGDIARWDTSTGHELPRLVAGEGQLGAGAGPLSYLDLPGGRFVLTPCANGVIRVWNAVTGQEVSIPGRYVTGTRACGSGDGQVVAAWDDTGRIDLWNAETGRIIRVLRESGPLISSLVVNHDGSQVALLDSHNRIERWDVATGNRDPVPLRQGATQLNPTLASRYYLRKPVASPTPSPRPLHAVIDSTTGEVAWELPLSGMNSPLEPPYSLSANASSPWNVQRLSDDGRTVVMQRAMADGWLLSVIDVPNQKELARIKGGLIGPHIARWLRGFWLSPDGKWLLIRTDDPTYRTIQPTWLWDLTTGKLAAELPLKSTTAWFSPDNKSLISFEEYGIGCIGYRWDIKALIAAHKK